MSNAGGRETTSPPPAITDPPPALVALIRPKIRWRFRLDAEAFARRLVDVIEAQEPGGSSRQESVMRLSLDDLYLAWACVLGEDAAWKELAQAHFGFIRTFARRYLGADAATDAADDVVADLWERRKLERYLGRSTLRTWLGALVAHRAINVATSVRRQESRDNVARALVARAGGPANDDDAAHQEARTALRSILGEAFRALPGEARLLLQLYYEQELTLDDMSRALSVSTAVLSRRLKATREELRAAIEARARQQTGISADVLREGVDLARLEVDLGALLNENCRTAV